MPWKFARRSGQAQKAIQAGQSPFFSGSTMVETTDGGNLGFHAGSLTPSQALLSEFTVIANKGTRMVADLHHRFNIGERLRSVRSELAIDVPIIFRTFLVCRISHVFRQPDCPLFRFYSLQSTSMLRSLRSAGSRSNVSLSKLFSWNVLSCLGLGIFWATS